MIQKGQDELSYTRDYLEAIFESNPNMTIVTNAHEIEKINTKVLEFTGFKDLDAFKKEHQSVCDLFLENQKDCIKSTIDGEVWIDYILARPKKKHIVCMQHNQKLFYFNVIVTPLTIGKEKKYLVVFNDVTEITNLEKKLEKSKKMFDLFMDYMPYVIVIKDENLLVRYANKMAKEYAKNIVNGTKAEENMDKRFAVKIDALGRDAQKNGFVEDVMEYSNSDGDFILRALAFPIPQENGAIYVGSVYIDITQEKKLSDELKEQKELMIAQSRHAAMGEMISMIAHQWRQPISVISMDANNILADIELDEVEGDSLENDVNDIVAQTQYLSQTIDDFRNFFKPNKQKNEVVVSDVMNKTLHIVEKSFENNDISLENDFQTESKIRIFSHELLQVFLNILTNAKEELVRNRANNRKITNKIYEDEENIIIEISDNAGGIDDTIIAKIFDPYFSTKDEMNGTGLGLYMSKVIVEKHLLGEINASNTKEGAQFKIVLPKKENETDNES